MDKVNIELALLATLVEQFKAQLKRHENNTPSMFHSDFDTGYELAMKQVIEDLEEKMVELSGN